MKRILLSFFTLALTISGESPANHPADPELISLTDYIIKMGTSHSNAPDTQKAALIEKLERAALHRKVLLERSLDGDPHGFILVALPVEAKARLPLSVQYLVEDHITVSGIFTIYRVDDFRSTAPRYFYELEDVNGGKYRLHFVQIPPGLLSGAEIRVKGVALGSQLVVQGDSASITILQSITPSAVTGDKKVIVIMINFINNATQPFTQASVDATMFTGGSSVNQYYQNTSFGQVSVSGNVWGWFTIASDSSAGCNYSTWATQADQAATNAGANLANYGYRMYIFPIASSCGWYGLASGTRSWINGYNQLHVEGHEFGHNLGVHHAARLTCGTKAIDVYTNCMYSEYGDPYEIMGNISARQFNAPHKVALGWLPLTRVTDVTLNGSYSITPLEVSSSQSQALRIKKPNTNEYYFVSYRQPLGTFDGSLPVGITRGGGIHVWNGNPWTQTKFLDATPGDGSIGDSALSDGSNFYDAINGITVMQSNHDALQATFEVKFSGPTCSKMNPMVSLSPSSQTGAASVMKSYTLSVKNNDSLACPQVTFNLKNQVPTGWASLLSSGSLILSPGASGSTTLSVTPHSSAIDGIYPISASATDAVDSTHTGSANATYVVLNLPSDTIAPTVQFVYPADQASVPRRQIVTIKVSATDNVGVTSLSVLVAEKPLLCSKSDSNYLCDWKVPSRKNGDYLLSATAKDAAGNSSTATIMVHAQ